MQLRRQLCAGIIALISGFAFAQDRITSTADSARVVPLRGHVHPLAQPRYDQGAVDASREIGMVTLLLAPSPAQQADLDGLLARQQNASSLDFHRWLTPEQFAERFGATAADIAKITAWLQSEGLQVNNVARGRGWITFSGSAERVGHAFRTEIHRYDIRGESHFANATDPSIPAAFEQMIGAINGLNDFDPQSAPPALVKPLYDGAAGRHYLAPNDIATIYDVKPLHNAGIDGTGQSIAVIGVSDINLADVRSFRQQFALPAQDPQLVLIGRDPGRNAGELEADLDLEWSGAIAPQASIFYVYAQSFLTAAQYAVDQNIAPVISTSFSYCEREITPAYRSVLQQANAQGITWITASGDAGAAGCDHNSYVSQATRGLSVGFPASAPEVTAVGGTTFSEGAGNYWASANNVSGGSALSYIPEVAWNDYAITDALWGTGGGFSTYFTKPGWQRGSGVPDDGARDVPDIALAASAGHDGYLVVSAGTLFAVGGTSAGTPEFAGMVALLNHSLSQSAPGRQGNINAVLYRLAQSTSDVFHDITSGDNIMPCGQGSPDCSTGSLGYQAGPGYDLATGLGSVDVYKMVTEWASVASATPVTTTTVRASPNGIDFYGGPVLLTATVSSPGGTPTGTVAFVSKDTNLGSASLNNGTASVTVNASQLGAGTPTVAAVYSGDGIFSGSTGTATVTVTAPAGAAIAVSVSPNPVYQQNPNANGFTWLYTIRLTEEAGVAATIGSFTVDGAALSITGFFGTATIPGNGTLSAVIESKNLTAPITRVFALSGTDANGQSWSVQIPVRYLPAKLVSPGLTLNSTPVNVVQNPSADPSCQWSQQLTVEELGGYTVALTKLIAGGLDLSSQIQQIFGTTRLGAFGTLAGTVCFSGIRAPVTQNYELDGTTDQGATVVATTSASLLPSLPLAVTLSASPASVSIQAAAQSSGDASLALSFGGAAPGWQISVLPSRASSWLTVSQLSGGGAAQLNIHASGAGLANGVYSAILVVQAVNASPQDVNVPVTFVVGASSSATIAGIANGASFKTALAPGMVMSIFGSQLAPPGTSLAASLVPLPLNLAGVSATVNGISAPLYYVSPGQLNVQIPYETGAGRAVLGLNNNGDVVSFPFQVSPAAPGIFTDGNGNLAPFASGRPGDTLLLFLTGDGDLTPTLPTGMTPSYGTPVSRLPQPRQQVTLTVGGIPATIQFVGVPPGLAGVTQVNFTIPQNIAPGPQQVVIAVGGVQSQAATITVNQ